MKLSTSFVGYAAIALSIVGTHVHAQQPGHLIEEKHPPLPLKVCRKVSDQANKESVTCETEATSVVIDVGRRLVNAVGSTKSSTKSCYADDKWDTSVCSTPESCAKTCEVEGALYETNHSITTSGDEINLKLKSLTKLSARVYMLDAMGTKYRQFDLLNKEFTFNVDLSLMPCGSNGALYFVKMDADGGTSRFPVNTAGASYGTGYCDAQCPRTIRFVNGEANMNKTLGSCCAEMDVLEANSMSTAYATHACSIQGQQVCTAEKDCGSTKETKYSGWCDQPGCSYNPFRMGNKNFYGPGKDFEIDTTRPFTVITQFVTHDNTSTGELVEIRRLYKQDDRIIKNPSATWPELDGANSITDAMCTETKTLFKKHPYKKGDLANLGRQMIGGMTLVISLWADYSKNMSWLDSFDREEDDPKIIGNVAGTCPNPGGDPASVFANYPNAGTKFSDIRTGEFGTTY